MRRHITFYRHFSATTEEQVTELLKRIKELTGMLDSASLQISTLYFKSFNLCDRFQTSNFLILLTSNPFDFKSLQMKAALEARHQDCVSSADVAKQLDERDAAHKAEVEQLKSRITELLDEKEERDGQLKKVQGLLATSEADAAGAKLELQHLKEQATKWEVDIARLNVDLASKLQILFCPTHLV
jgi:chromosome segregation ATPase